VDPLPMPPVSVRVEFGLLPACAALLSSSPEIAKKLMTDFFIFQSWLLLGFGWLLRNDLFRQSCNSYSMD